MKKAWHRTASTDQKIRMRCNKLQSFYIEKIGNEDQYVAPQSILKQMKRRFEVRHQRCEPKEYLWQRR